MIALNKIIENKEQIINKYNLMGYNFNIEKIYNLTQKFKTIDQNNGKFRAECNTLCSNIATLRNEQKSTNELILKINSLDKLIKRNTKQANKMYFKINKKLKRLPNIAKDDNKLNILISKSKISIKKEEFINEIKQKHDLKNTTDSLTKLLNTNKNMVFDEENLPNFINKNYIIMFANHENYDKINQDLINYLTRNSKLLIKKSIRQLKKESEQEFVATLSDGYICFNSIGEYLSRDFNIKYKNNEKDVTQFVKIIIISIK